MTRGSVTETQNHLGYGNRVGFFKNEELRGLEKRLEGMYNDRNKIILKFRTKNQ